MDTVLVKKILNISTTKYDTYFDTVIPMIEDDVKAETNRDFIDDDTGEVVYPGGIKLLIAKIAEHGIKESGLKSRSMGNVSYEYDTDVPDNLKRKIRKYRRLSW
jgi:hypothetical protein